MDTIQTFFSGLDNKRFYQYTGILLGVVILITGGLLFQYYHSTSTSEQEIESINESRALVKKILAKAKYVKRKHKEVNEMLAQDENFKIAQYFTDLIGKLGLTNKSKEIQTSPVDREDEFREVVLTAKFVNMSMKELTELLEAIEKTHRISTKELEISQPKKNDRSVDVSLAIATLQPKEESE